MMPIECQWFTYKNIIFVAVLKSMLLFSHDKAMFCDV